MLFSRLSLAAVAVSQASAVTLWATSYLGGLYSLELGKTATGYSLAQTSFQSGNTTAAGEPGDGCGPDASWLTINAKKDVVYCVDEAWGMANGTIFAYNNKNGSLELFNKTTTLQSPVSTVIYNGGKALAAAHYDTHAVTTFAILPGGALKQQQQFTYTAAIGPNAGRQDSPHEHQVILDPTGSFIVVPDLGADLLRVFAINKNTSMLSESSTHATAPGAGPRHGTFLKTGNSTFLFVIAELANSVTSYKVDYMGGGLMLTQVFTSGAYGMDVKIPEGAGAAEAILSPDHKYLLTSERHVASYQIANYDTKNSTTLPSDALIVWTIDHATGKLSNAMRSPAGGMNPRQFSVNKKGDLAAVGLQDDGRVVIIERNMTTGAFGSVVASVMITGLPTSVVWNE